MTTTNHLVLTDGTSVRETVSTWGDTHAWDTAVGTMTPRARRGDEPVTIGGVPHYLAPRYVLTIAQSGLPYRVEGHPYAYRTRSEVARLIRGWAASAVPGGARYVVVECPQAHTVEVMDLSTVSDDEMLA